MGIPLRYEPLEPTLFPVGSSPFRARGLAYVMALKYVDTRLPGGRAAFLAELGPGHPFAGFYDQLFLVSGDYDVSPLMRLYLVCARIEHVDVGRLIANRARRSAESDTKGVWRPMLKASTPMDAVEKTPFAFERYFPPCQAAKVASGERRFEGELSRLPSCMTGLYASATTGFIEGALALAGANNPKVEWLRTSPDGALSGVTLERARFAATWR